MGERKVLNKYYPPDFDPDKLRDNKKLIRRQRAKYQEIRMMMPWTAVCLTCGEFIPRGKKVNSRMERFRSDHFGVYAFRFFIRCLVCREHFTFVTDPKNADYVPERNCKRTFDLWIEERDREAAKGRLEPVLEGEDGEEEEEEDQMAALEARTRESKREIDAMDALDELRSMNARNQAVDLDGLLKGMVQPAKEDQPVAEISKEEEEEVKRLFQQRRDGAAGGGEDGGGARVRRLDRSAISARSAVASQAAAKRARTEGAAAEAKGPQGAGKKPRLPGAVIVKKRARPSAAAAGTKGPTGSSSSSSGGDGGGGASQQPQGKGAAGAADGSLAGLMGDYGSDDSAE